MKKKSSFEIYTTNTKKVDAGAPAHVVNDFASKLSQCGKQLGITTSQFISGVKSKISML